MAAIAQRDKSLLPISAGVIVVHFLLIFYSALFFTSHIPVPKDRDRLVVKTVKLNPRQSQFNPPKQAAPAPIAPPEPIPEPVAEVEPAKPEPLPEPEKIPEKAPEPLPEPAPKPEPKPEPKPVAPKPLPKKKPVLKKSAPKTPPKPVKKQPPPKPPAPVKKETPKKPEPKKETPKKAAETPPSPPRPDPQIEAKKQKQKALLDSARSAIANVDRKSGQIKETGSLEKVALPSQLGALSIDLPQISSDSNLSVMERGYRDELASRLKLMLKLPEYGVVKLKLTLNRQGKVTDVTIIQSDSAANKSHIKKALPPLTFPSFGDNFPGLDSYTFQVTLNSE